MSILKPWLRKRNDLLKPITFFLFIDLLSFSSRGITEAQSDLFSLDNLSRMISLTICVLLLTICFVKKRRIAKLKGPIKWLGLYFLFGFISLFNTTWILYALVKYFEYFVVLLYAIYVIELEQEGKDAIIHVYELLVSFLNILLITVLLGAILSPSKAFITGENDYSSLKNAILPFILKGWIIVISPTSVGYFSAFLAFKEFYSCFTKKITFKNISLLALYLSVMILAQCRTAIFAFFLVCTALVLLNAKSYKSFLLTLAISVLLIMNINFLFTFLTRGQDTNAILSLSGRTEWWKYAIDFYNEQPFFKKFFGLGFAAAEKLVASSSNSKMYALDSEILGILIGTGVLGLFCWGMSIVSCIATIVDVWKNRLKINTINRDRCIISSGIILIIIVRMLTASTLSVTNYYLVTYIILNLVIYKFRWGEHTT